jgi:hypothetical protein
VPVFCGADQSGTKGPLVGKIADRSAFSGAAHSRGRRRARHRREFHKLASTKFIADLRLSSIVRHAEAVTSPAQRSGLDVPGVADAFVHKDFVKEK